MWPIRSPHQPLRVGTYQCLVKRPRVRIAGELIRQSVGRGQFHVYMAFADEPEQRLKPSVLRTLPSGDVKHVIDDHRHLSRDVSKGCGQVLHQPPVTEDLHDPAKLTHGSPKYLEDVQPDTAHVARTADFREEMKPQPRMPSRCQSRRVEGWTRVSVIATPRSRRG